MGSKQRCAANSISVLKGLGAGLALLAAPPLAADVKTGVDAWSAGDYSRAVEEWRGPAARGDSDALFNLAQAYRLGRGVSADIERAKELYLQAAQQGHIRAADNYGLLLFQQGEQEKSMPLIEGAAGRGDPRAQYILGLSHFNADYAEKDWVRAYALLSLSQAAGLPQAQRALVQMDQYIPLSQRQEAQSLAVKLKAEADQRLNAQLAASDLGVPDSAPATQSAVPPPARVASARPAPVEARGVPRGLPPAPRPVPQYRLPAGSSAPAPKRATAREPYRAGTAEPTASTAPVRSATAQASSNGPWGLQLGAFGVSSNADRLWAKLSRNPALAGTRKSLVTSGSVTRLMAVGFASRSSAAKACSALKSQGQDCLVKKT